MYVKWKNKQQIMCKAENGRVTQRPLKYGDPEVFSER